MDNENRERQPPLLLTIHHSQHPKQSIYRQLDSQTHIMCIPILVGKCILASTHGWLVLVDQDDGECCLWNPESNDMIGLPRLEESYLYHKCVLSKLPTEPDCHILFYSTIKESFCQIGDADFIQEDYRLIAVASFQGKIYGVIKPDYKFVTIDFVGRTMKLRPILIDGEHPWKVPQPERNWVVWQDNHLVESSSGNELLLVTEYFTHNYINDSSEIRVFRVDINRMECSELDEIGDQTIFIGYNGTGFCCSSCGSNKIKPNSIYYTLSFGEYVYIYDLDDKSRSSWLPRDIDCQVVKNYWIDIDKLSC